VQSDRHSWELQFAEQAQAQVHHWQSVSCLACLQSLSEWRTTLSCLHDLWLRIRCHVGLCDVDGLGQQTGEGNRNRSTI